MSCLHSHICTVLDVYAYSGDFRYHRLKCTNTVTPVEDIPVFNIDEYLKLNLPFTLEIR